MKLIAFTGPKGCGKSTFAKMVVNHSKVLPGPREILSFAGPLKAMLRAILPPEAYTPEGKEDVRYGMCGRTPRYLMQTLGTEWGRRMVGEDVWVEAVRHQILGSGAQTILIDDLRFNNEAEMVMDLGGEVWSIHRDGISWGGGHESESGIDPCLLSGTLPIQGGICGAMRIAETFEGIPNNPS